MFVPDPPDLTQLDKISPSLYEAGINCLAKASWYAFGDAGIVPTHPSAILGISFHAVLAAAHKGELRVISDKDQNPARKLFDKTTQDLFAKAHQLIKLKFNTAERLPYYNLQRERAALLATPIAASRFSSSGYTGKSKKVSTLLQRTESRLSSFDGIIVGRADHIDGKSGTVIDYKSGNAPSTAVDSVSESEARQLYLYAYLAIENGIHVSKGTIVRGNGQRCSVSISEADAKAEADNARNQLQKFNAAVNSGAVFGDLTSPSLNNCILCPCIPFCHAFWDKALPIWADECGTHIEGHVMKIENRQIQGVSLTTLIIETDFGTVAEQQASIEQIPSSWLKIEKHSMPRPGEVVRIVHGRRLDSEKREAIIRIDKTMTAVWCVRPSIHQR